MSLKDQVQSVDYELERARHDDTKVELRQARRTIEEQQREIARLREVANLRVDTRPNPEWLRLRKGEDFDDNRAILCAMLSDTHFGEVINPDELQGKNAYNKDIGDYRLERFFEKVAWLSSNYISGVKYDGAVIPLGGDMVSGDIHQELVETNDFPSNYAVVRYYYPKIADGLTFMADTFGRVHVPCVVGNHGRNSKKPRHKVAALNNADWLLYSLVADRLEKDDRITFDVPEALDVEYKVYRTRFLMNHGQTGGGQGIGGIWPPIMRLRAGKERSFDFDWFNIGHWHQYVHGQGLTINGSLKGYDEFAQDMRFAPERAQQALWIVTPENGVTMAAPVFCSGSPKAEGWGRGRRGRRA